MTTQNLVVTDHNLLELVERVHWRLVLVELRLVAEGIQFPHALHLLFRAHNSCVAMVSTLNTYNKVWLRKRKYLLRGMLLLKSICGCILS